MHKVKRLLSQQPSSYNNIMLWAACCLAFFGFLRVSKFTMPTQADYVESTHLSIKDIFVDSHSNPCLVKVHINTKQSKTDPFRQSADVYLGATDNPICPVSGILPYLRGTQLSPLFITSDGRSLNRSLFSGKMDAILVSLQIDTNKYNTHSFRIGAATTTTQAQITEAHIKMLGRWCSVAYQRYIKMPPQELAQLSKQLVSPSD